MIKRIILAPILGLAISTAALAQTNTVPISQLPTATTPYSGSEVVPIVQFGPNGVGITRKAALPSLFSALGGDCTSSLLAVMICTKTNGVPFGALATLGIGSNLVSSGGNLGVVAQPTFAGPNLTVGPGSGNAFLVLNGASGNSLGVTGFNALSARWQLLMPDSTTQSGGNVGGNFNISRYADNGALIDSPINIPRATGVVAMIDGATTTTRGCGDNSTNVATTAYVATCGTGGAGTTYTNPNLTHAASQTISSRLSIFATGRDDGPACTGAGDDTTNLNNVMSDVNAAAGGGIVLLPAAQCNFTGTLQIPAGVILKGQGKQATTLFANGANGQTAVQIGTCVGAACATTSINAQFAGLESVFVKHSAAQTGGSSIIVQDSHGVLIKDLYTFNSFIAVDWRGGPLQYIGWLENFELHCAASCISVGTGTAGAVQNLSIRDGGSYTNSGTGTGNGINIDNASGLILDNIEVLQMQYGVLVSPQAGHNAQYIFASKLILDTNAGNGLYIVPTANTGVYLARFTDLWSASSTGGSGVVIDCSAAGSICNGFQFTSPILVNNFNFGLYDNLAVNVEISNPMVCSNSQTGSNVQSGVWINNNTHNVSVIGGKIGACGNLAEKQKYAVTLGTGTDYINVIGMDGLGNLTGSINNASAGTHINLTNNF
ncbi:hypothetical protein SAMN05519103_00353 [Rhizobiales bacterium GAS113]|nr:hypothetical protein SAMN05519103_00353 [Rhizobiales bacterium GAS113]